MSTKEGRMITNPTMDAATAVAGSAAATGNTITLRHLGGGGGGGSCSLRSRTSLGSLVSSTKGGCLNRY
jgi:hypothetical protein